MSKRNREKALRTDTPVPSPARTEEEKRVRRVRTMIGAVVVIAVLGILTATLIAVLNKPADTTVKPDPNSYRPANAIVAGDKYEYGVSYYTPKQKVPVVEIFEDFQCPICAKFESGAGDILARYAKEGRARIIWRPATFLDQNLSNDASSRAANAWGCAQDVGKGLEYHAAVYANQPTQEGAGWTNEQLVSFGVMAGMNEDEFKAFQTCLKAKPYLPWAANSNQAFQKNGLNSTPTVRIDGVVIPQETAMNPVLLEQAIKDATPKEAQFPNPNAPVPSGSPSPSASASPSDVASPSATPTPSPTKKAKKSKK